MACCLSVLEVLKLKTMDDNLVNGTLFTNYNTIINIVKSYNLYYNLHIDSNIIQLLSNL